MTRARRPVPQGAGDDDEILATIEAAMVRLRRNVMRRRLARGAHGPGGVDALQFAVVDAVEAGPDPGAGEITVGAVAERLSIDPSQASRLVAQAITDGLIRREASQRDGRRIGLALTREGAALVERKHALRRAYVDGLMAGWSDRDRRDFARLIERFTAPLDDEPV
ncbi:MAG: MarR family transcriptional regulator [Alphaproteobacteria bacterium]|nr:MarR family transcriptional regulator [Alphaproteobacteria bacterium]